MNRQSSAADAESIGLGDRPVIGYPHRLLLAGPGRHRAHDEAERLGPGGPELEMHPGRDGQRGPRLDLDNLFAAILLAPDLPPARGDKPDLFDRAVDDGQRDPTW